MDELKRIASEAEAIDPAVGLKGVVTLRRLLDRLEAVQVTNARKHGWTWERIATVLGVSRQAVHKKHAGGSRGTR